MTTFLTVMLVWLVASIPLGILVGRMLRRSDAEQTVPQRDAAWGPADGPGPAYARKRTFGAALARSHADG